MTNVVNARSTNKYDAPIFRGRGLYVDPNGLSQEFRVDGTHITTKEEAVQRFRRYFLARVENDPKFRSYVLSLRDKRLGCDCRSAGTPNCHGSVIADWLNNLELEQ